MSINFPKVLECYLSKTSYYILLFTILNPWCFSQEGNSYLTNVNPDSLRLKSIDAHRTTIKLKINGMNEGEIAKSVFFTERLNPK